MVFKKAQNWEITFKHKEITNVIQVLEKKSSLQSEFNIISE